jgi:hypothetical protein
MAFSLPSGLSYRVAPIIRAPAKWGDVLCQHRQTSLYSVRLHYPTYRCVKCNWSRSSGFPALPTCSIRWTGKSSALLSAIMPHYGLVAAGGTRRHDIQVTVAIFGALSGWFMARFGRKAVLVGGLVAYSK